MKRRHRKKGRKLCGIAIALAVVAAVVLLYQAGRWLETRNAKPQPRADYQQSASYGQIIEVDGVSYQKRNGVTSILIMGVDRREDAVASGYRNGGQADFLRLIVINSVEKTVSQLQIDRDTMTPITILGVLGNQSGMRTSQICLSHGFGDGREQSCELTRDAVSNLLLSTDIDFYVAMNLDGISVLNDWVGGVTVTLEDDFSALDPTMTAGKTMTLVGDQAEYYVRNRLNIGVGTNEARMKRQQVYISELTELLTEKLEGSESEIGALYDVLEPYLITDMSRGRMINELWAAKDYTRNELIIPQGTYQTGSDGFMQFIVDEQALEQVVLNLFYTEVK